MIRQIAESAFPKCHVAAFELLGNGFSNSNYKVTLHGVPDPFVIRIHSGNGDIAEKERNISRMVSGKVPVAEYIHVDESRSVVDRPFSILEWKNGISLTGLMRSMHDVYRGPAAESAGEVLAEIHKHEFSVPGFLDGKLEVVEPMRIDEDSFISLIRHFLDRRCGTFLGDGTVDRVMSFCRVRAHRLSDDENPPVLVHSDYNGMNILMDVHPGGASVSAVLDWEYAFAGSRYADIGNMLRYEREGSDFEASFLRGYESRGGILGDNWRMLSKLHDLIALCDLLDRSSVETPKRVQDLTHLIRQAVK